MRLTASVIKEEHVSMLAMLQSLVMMVRLGPREHPRAFFNTVRAMLFYFDEIPERQHHRIESEYLFSRLEKVADDKLKEALAKLEKDHRIGESEIRRLQHHLLAWEFLGEARRTEFEELLKRYVYFYEEHMQLEESAILPAAEKLLSEQDWQEMDVAFSKSLDPLGVVLKSKGKAEIEPLYEALFHRIVREAPPPIGLGEAGR
jgi:hemerythrin-like domain-containing protein